MTASWAVRRHPTGRWGVYDDWCLHDLFDTHAEAIIWARRYAVGTAVFNGALGDGRRVSMTEMDYQKFFDKFDAYVQENFPELITADPLRIPLHPHAYYQEEQ